MKKLTPAQLRTLKIIEPEGLTIFEQTIYGVREDVLDKLHWNGLIKWIKRGRPKRWAITLKGKEAIKTGNYAQEKKGEWV